MAKGWQTPRVNHSITQEVDYFGNVLRSVAISYPRRPSPNVIELEQQQTHIVLTLNRYANGPAERDWYRLGLPVEARVFEVVKPPDPKITDSRIEPSSLKAYSELTQKLLPLDHIEPDTAMIWPYERWDWRRNPANMPQSSRLRLLGAHTKHSIAKTI
jgi:hypothetical protein